MTEQDTPTAASGAPPAIPSALRVHGAPTAGTARGWVSRVFITLFLLGLFTPALLLADDAYWLPVVTRYMCLALFAVSVDLIWGYTGLLSLGQGLFFGMGV